MERFDVLIVGGGPAGSASAWALRQAGMNVAIVDKAHFPRDKVCAGWISPNVLKALQIEASEYAEQRTLQPIFGFRIGLMRNAKQRPKVSENRYPKAVGFGILRREFDHYLLMRSGARLFTGEPVVSLRSEGKEWIINDHLRAPMLIGAGGHACPVARMLGAKLDSEASVIAKEIEFLLPEEARAECKVAQELPELYFCSDLSGYGWCMRKGDYMNIGLGRDDRWEIANHVERFLLFLERERGVQLPAVHLKGYAYLLYGRGNRRHVSDRALLIGDAAGLANAQSGEGIRPAVESGLFAAQTIIEADGNYSKRQLFPYENRVQRRFGQPASLPGMLVSTMPAWMHVSLARSLFSSARLVRWIVLDNGFLQAKSLVQLPANRA